MSRPEPEYTLASLEAEPVADFTSLTRDDAVRLGEVGIAVIREWNRNLAIEVRVGAELAFRAQLGTTGEENAAAISGKVATVTALGVSSLLARRRHEAGPDLRHGPRRQRPPLGRLYPDLRRRRACRHGRDLGRAGRRGP